jgi:hypothetical protein
MPRCTRAPHCPRTSAGPARLPLRAAARALGLRRPAALPVLRRRQRGHGLLRAVRHGPVRRAGRPLRAEAARRASAQGAYKGAHRGQAQAEANSRDYCSCSNCRCKRPPYRCCSCCYFCDGAACCCDSCCRCACSHRIFSDRDYHQVADSYPRHSCRTYDGCHTSSDASGSCSRFCPHCSSCSSSCLRRHA